jgi:hypothetical protein
LLTHSLLMRLFHCEVSGSVYVVTGWIDYLNRIYDFTVTEACIKNCSKIPIAVAENIIFSNS